MFPRELAGLFAPDNRDVLIIGVARLLVMGAPTIFGTTTIAVPGMGVAIRIDNGVGSGVGVGVNIGVPGSARPNVLNDPRAGKFKFGAGEAVSTLRRFVNAAVTNSPEPHRVVVGESKGLEGTISGDGRVLVLMENIALNGSEVASGPGSEEGKSEVKPGKSSRPPVGHSDTAEFVESLILFSAVLPSGVVLSFDGTAVLNSSTSGDGVSS